ncbi:PEP-CTERM sorting domain-containing protein [Schlesneria sp. DSM 10557]|uniref:PEP-CTERM sorting domain-containing protein n=1 Tax=Schlesneria sp. DSM 10557 TaxID=3044399 RepID=UPI0035A06B72
MTVEYQGVTKASRLDGISIPDGTSFILRVASSTTPINDLNVGQGVYAVLSMTAEVDGVHYEGDGTGVYLTLADSTAPFKQFHAFLLSGSNGTFAPAFTGSTADPWSAQSPTSTEFTNYLGSYGTEIYLRSPSSELVLGYAPEAGVSVTFSVVPEPSTLALAGLGVIGLAHGTIRRRYQTV